MDRNRRLIQLAALVIVIMALLIILTALAQSRTDAATPSPHPWSEAPMHDYIFKESK